jgi:hypothetical protein
MSGKFSFSGSGFVLVLHINLSTISYSFSDPLRTWQLTLGDIVI